MTISQRIQEHQESLLSSAGNKPLSNYNAQANIHAHAQFAQSCQSHLFAARSGFSPAIGFSSKPCLGGRQYQKKVLAQNGTAADHPLPCPQKQNASLDV
jgi:hypothetical protein